MKTLRKILSMPLFAAALILNGSSSIVAAPNVTASLDSAYILMGKQTTLHIDSRLQGVHGPVRLLLPEDTLVTNVEVISSATVDSNEVNGILSIRHDVVIQSFDSGLYMIPPVKLLVGHDTLLSNHSVLKVVPVAVDSLDGRIHDFADVSEPSHNFFDFIPGKIYGVLWWILLAVLIIASGIYAYFYFRKRKTSGDVSTVTVIPPYEEAIAALDKLRSEKLCEKGYEREFYTRLTDILRNYLDRRFGISAMEMTTTEILRSLSNNSETRLTRHQMEEVLSMADFVKFAKVRPLPDDNVKTFNSALNFVESTRPSVQPDPETKDVNKDTK